MSWNADNTVWTNSATRGNNADSLTHLGSGEWRFTTRDMGYDGDEFSGSVSVNWGDDSSSSASGEDSENLNHTYGTGINSVTLVATYDIDGGGGTVTIEIPEVNPDNPYVAPPTGATHRINVTARNVDHWSWSVDGGPETMMPPGSTYADITIGAEPETFNTPTYGVKLQLKNWITARLGHTNWTCIDLQRCGHLEPVTWSGITNYLANSWITEVSQHPSENTTTVQDSHLNYGIQNCISTSSYDNKAQMYQAVKVTLDNEGDREVIIPVENYYNNAVTVSSYDGITS